MSTRIALLFLTAAALLQGIASGQLVINNHATGLALPSPFQLPDSPVNDTEQIQIDIVNTGTTVASVNSAVVFGEYYTLCCHSAFTLAPGGIQTLMLSFSPLDVAPHSGSLQVDGQTILLFATGVPAASLYVQTAAGLVQAHLNAPLDFTIAPGPTTFVLENNWSGPVTVSLIYVIGDWAFDIIPPTPFLIQPGQRITFALDASAPAGGSAPGTISIDQWSYLIEAQPSQPAMQIQVASPLKSAQQSSIGIQFNPPPTTAFTGALQLTFDSATSIAVTDPAIIFPATGTTTVEFTSVVGQAAASFSGASTVAFQTGTTQGTIHVAATWLDASVTSDVAITAEPVGIESISASRESNALDVTVTGYDNTRTAGAMSFSFFNSQGAFIGDAVPADFTEAFYNYFFQAAYNAGGMFKMIAHFPVTGNPGEVNSVQVDLMNSAGDAQSSTTPF